MSRARGVWGERQELEMKAQALGAFTGRGLTSGRGRWRSGAVWRLEGERVLIVALLTLAACNRRDVPKTQSTPDPALGTQHPVTIHQPERLGRVRLGEPGAQGSSLVKCETCHALRPPSVLPASMQELDQFHQGLELHHGNLSCAACHTQGAPTTLHLADGRALAPGQAMELCRQCHGPQYRDYEHGAHGGMTGHWDLSRGPRTRNHCMDCHDPHAPQISKMIPAPPPGDRFFGDPAARGPVTTPKGGAH